MSDAGGPRDDEDTEEARAARAAALREATRGGVPGRPPSPRDVTNEAARRAAEEQSETEPDPGDQ